MDLITIALVLLIILTVLLGAGVWIAIGLMACGYAGMLFVGGNIPPGSVLATTVWGNSASWALAALPLFIWMGEILFRTRLSEEMFRGLSPWLNWLPGRLMHVNVWLAASSARCRARRRRPAPRWQRSRCRS
jgi:TRAP-type mannitol/chloroaromatic compound transport system permease large subunit